MAAQVNPPELTGVVQRGIFLEHTEACFVALGTAEGRANAAATAARAVDLNQPWADVRQELVTACGLRVQRSTSHW